MLIIELSCIIRNLNILVYRYNLLTVNFVLNMVGYVTGKRLVIELSCIIRTSNIFVYRYKLLWSSRPKYSEICNKKKVDYLIIVFNTHQKHIS